MSTPTINTPQVRPVPYVRSSMPSLDRLQSRISPAAGITFAAAASTWLIGDQDPSAIAFLAGLSGMVGSVAIAAGPVVSILNDARDGHAPRDRDLAPAVAAVLVALAVAAWFGLWIQAAVLVAGTGVIAVQLVALVREARIQLGKEWEL